VPMPGSRSATTTRLAAGVETSAGSSRICGDDATGNWGNVSSERYGLEPETNHENRKSIGLELRDRSVRCYRTANWEELLVLDVVDLNRLAHLRDWLITIEPGKRAGRIGLVKYVSHTRRAHAHRDPAGDRLQGLEDPELR